MAAELREGFLSGVLKYPDLTMWSEYFVIETSKHFLVEIAYTNSLDREEIIDAAIEYYLHNEDCCNPKEEDVTAEVYCYFTQPGDPENLNRALVVVTKPEGLHDV